MSFGPCSEDLKIEIFSIPGDYTVTVGAESQTFTNAATGPNAISTVIFEDFAFEPGVLYTVSVYPTDNPSCVNTTTFQDLGCNPEFEVSCLGAAGQEIRYTGGCPSMLYLEVTAGSWTSVDGPTIQGVDGTTEFKVVTSNGCEITGLGVADATDVDPCSGDYETCTYFTDFGYTITEATSANIEIFSVVVDGVEYVDNPVPLGPPNIVTIGAESYNTAFVDVINSLGIPTFYAENPTEAQIITAQAVGASVDKRNNIIRFVRPDCVSFTVQARHIGATGTQSPQTYTWTETTYTPSGGIPVAYAQAAALDCSTATLCP